MLADIFAVDEIFIVCGYTDMRKSTDGLCVVVQGQLEINPVSNSLFLFCGRRRDRMIVLPYEPDAMF